MSKSEAPERESEGTGSIYAPGASKSGSGIRLHVGVKDLAYVVAIVGAGWAWFQSRASKDDLAAVKTACMEEISKRTAPIGSISTQLNAVEDAVIKDGKRWDRLDEFHSTVKAFNQSNKTPPPKFGPKAEVRGELPRDWDK